MFIKITKIYKHIFQKHKLLIFTRTVYLENWSYFYADEIEASIVSYENSYSVCSYIIADEINFISQQGYVLFENDKNTYPMESLTKIHPFQFTDETELFYLTSSYNSYNDAEKTSSPCFWQFLAPNGYGFKVVIKSLILTKVSKMTIQNSTDIIAKYVIKLFYYHVFFKDFSERSLKYGPYYNSDNYIQISFKSMIENLEVYISVVKSNVTKVDNGCHKFNINAVTIWTNIRYTGYKNNVKCMFHLVVPENSEVRVSIPVFMIEEVSDYIIYYIKDKHFNNSIGTQLLHPANYIFRQNVTWEFVSDGSVQSLGFLFNFMTIGD